MFTSYLKYQWPKINIWSPQENKKINKSVSDTNKIVVEPRRKLSQEFYGLIFFHFGFLLVIALSHNIAKNNKVFTAV